MFSLMHGLLDLGMVTVGILRSICLGIAVAIEESRWRPSSSGPHEQTWSFHWKKRVQTLKLV